jgi:tRNA(fMet)-specific endonuclease VapC
VTARFLLDTSIVSAPISRVPHAGVLKHLEERGHECAVAAPVWHELTYGCQRLPRGKRRDAIETYLQDVVLASFPVLVYDEDAAYWHGVEFPRSRRHSHYAAWLSISNFNSNSIGLTYPIAECNRVTL